MTDRVKRMKESLKISKYPLCIEYFKLANESLDKTGGEPTLLRRAKLHEHVLDNITIFIEPDDLLCGSGASKPFGLEMQYEYGVWTPDEVEALKSEIYTISPEDEQELYRLNAQFAGNSLNANLIGQMSKSLGNFKTVRDVANVYGYEPIRYFIISAHYRKPINYSIEIIEQCKAALERLYNCKENLENYIAGADEKPLDAALKESVDAKKTAFIEAMEDDLNTADALAAVFELVRVANTAVAENKGKAAAEYALALFNELTDVLGLVYQSKGADSLDAQVEALIEQRSKARAEKNWAEADRIRDELKAMGIILKDTPQGVTWSKE